MLEHVARHAVFDDHGLELAEVLLHLRRLFVKRVVVYAYFCNAAFVLFVWLIGAPSMGVLHCFGLDAHWAPIPVWQVRRVVCRDCLRRRSDGRSQRLGDSLPVALFTPELWDHGAALVRHHLFIGIHVVAHDEAVQLFVVCDVLVVRPPHGGIDDAGVVTALVLVAQQLLVVSSLSLPRRRLSISERIQWTYGLPRR